ncbi:MAG: uroporphyrinogen decarboxylase [Pelagibacterales bacterium]|nr:uroporphyrinogen decarboxylase [Pelagibacterales bacterium]PPR16644.1 MAG: Uroporphyrinogen decarboxylase [Alphaproteobacteria bacterium MarineAlpha9_Bin3]
MDKFKNKSSFIKTLNGKYSSVKPIWLMRQAGRYLPEYREIRKKAGSFLNLCMNPKLSAEVTLQPLDRFDLDAAIIFSDILTIPMACDRDLRFVENEGPRLKPIKEEKEVFDLQLTNVEYLEPVYESLNLVKSELKEKKALIGFAGAPFTIAAYMIEGKGSKDFSNCIYFFNKYEKTFLELLNKLEVFISDHLIKQIEAGAEAIQIFESHAEIALKENKFKRFCIEPNKKIIKNIKKKYPNIPIIGFPRNAGNYYLEYVNNVNIDCLSIDQNVDILELINNLKSKKMRNICLQGNLNPEVLLKGGIQMERDIHYILESFSSLKHIFNLGHGVIKETPIENIHKLIKVIRDWEK